MEEEKEVDHIQAKSSSPLPTGLPINWGLVTGPIPQPVFPATSLSTQLPSPQRSAVHALQTKVKSLTQRRTRGRDREKEREKLDTESPAGKISSEVLLRQRPREKGHLPLPALSWRSAKTLSSSDEDEEVEVQVRLEIHSPPPEAQEEQVFGEGEKPDEDDTNESQVGFLSCGLNEGTSLESLLSDNSSSSKDDQSPPPPPPPVVSSCSASTSVTTCSPTSTSSTSTRHWAPPKGFWRVARPETLLLNGVGPHSISSTLPLKDFTETETLPEPQVKPKQTEAKPKSDMGGVAGEFKHSDSIECYLDRCEQKETAAKGLCRSESWESMASQSGALPADEKLKVKQRAYAKLRERQQNCREARQQDGRETIKSCEDTGSKGDSPGRSRFTSHR